MKIKQKRGYLLKHSAAIISIIAAVLILVDFAIPGELYQTEINEVKKPNSRIIIQLVTLTTPTRSSRIIVSFQ